MILDGRIKKAPKRTTISKLKQSLTSKIKHGWPKKPLTIAYGVEDIESIEMPRADVTVVKQKTGKSDTFATSALPVAETELFMDWLTKNPTKLQLVQTQEKKITEPTDVKISHEKPHDEKKEKTTSAPQIILSDEAKKLAGIPMNLVAVKILHASSTFKEEEFELKLTVQTINEMKAIYGEGAEGKKTAMYLIQREIRKAKIQAKLVKIIKEEHIWSFGE